MPLGTHSQKIGPYQLLSRIGRGGMAEVYLAVHEPVPGSPRLVAIKRVLSGLSEKNEFFEMFRDEIRILSKLYHPCLDQVLDAGMDKGIPYIVLDYVPGRDLGAILRMHEKKRLLPVDISVHVAARVASGLSHAHGLKDSSGKSLGIVHRDLSPENIIITFEGNVKVVDFGVARGTMREMQTAPGLVKGKPEYMAPEQMLSKPIDHRADIFALGVLLYRLTMGKHPFGVISNNISTYQRLLTFTPKPPHQEKAGYPITLSGVIMKALSRNPKKRHETAEDLLMDLEGVMTTRGWFPSDRKLAALMSELFPEVALSARRVSTSPDDPVAAMKASYMGGDSLRFEDKAQKIKQIDPSVEISGKDKNKPVDIRKIDYRNKRKLKNAQINVSDQKAAIALKDKKTVKPPDNNKFPKKPDCDDDIPTICAIDEEPDPFSNDDSPPINEDDFDDETEMSVLSSNPSDSMDEFTFTDTGCTPFSEVFQDSGISEQRSRKLRDDETINNSSDRSPFKESISLPTNPEHMKPEMETGKKTKTPDRLLFTVDPKDSRISRAIQDIPDTRTEQDPALLNPVPNKDDIDLPEAPETDFSESESFPDESVPTDSGHEPQSGPSSELNEAEEDKTKTSRPKKRVGVDSKNENSKYRETTKRTPRQGSVITRTPEQDIRTNHFNEAEGNNDKYEATGTESEINDFPKENISDSVFEESSQNMNYETRKQTAYPAHQKSAPSSATNEIKPLSNTLISKKSDPADTRRNPDFDDDEDFYYEDDYEDYDDFYGETDSLAENTAPSIKRTALAEKEIDIIDLPTSTALGAVKKSVSEKDAGPLVEVERINLKRKKSGTEAPPWQTLSGIAFSVIVGTLVFAAIFLSLFGN